MGTSNFGPLFEASHYYALLGSDFPTEESVEDHAQHIYDLLSTELDGIAEVTSANGYDVVYHRQTAVSVRNIAEIESEIAISKYDPAFSIYIRFNVFMVPGYYEGATVDYTYEVVADDGSTYDTDLTDFRENLEGLGICLSAEEYNKAIKDVNKTVDLIIDKLEQVLSKTTTCLHVSARFSNGETFYQPCKL